MIAATIAMDCADNFVDWHQTDRPHRKGRRKPSMQDVEPCGLQKALDRRAHVRLAGQLPAADCALRRSLTVYRVLSYRLLHDHLTEVLKIASRTNSRGTDCRPVVNWTSGALTTVPKSAGNGRLQRASAQRSAP